MLISILGSYGAGNLGDEAILLGIMKRFPDAKFVVFSHNPKLTLQIHPGVIARPLLPAGIRSYLKQFLNGDLRLSLAYLKKSDRILIGGGGIFYDSRFSRGRNPVKVWWNRVRLLRFMRLPYELYCIGVSKLKKNSSKTRMKLICDFAEKLCVRDKLSSQHLKDLGVDKIIQVLADPAYELKAPLKSSRENIFQVGIALRKWPKLKRIFHQVREELEHVQDQTNLQILLIPMSLGLDDDRKILRKFQQTLPPKLQACCTMLACSTPEQALEIISNLDLLIAMRLHALLFAKLAKVPSFPIHYDEKVQAVLNT